MLCYLCQMDTFPHKRRNFAIHLSAGKFNFLAIYFSACKFSFLANIFIFIITLSESNDFKLDKNRAYYFKGLYIMNIQKHIKNWLSGLEHYQDLPSIKTQNTILKHLDENQNNLDTKWVDLNHVASRENVGNRLCPHKTGQGSPKTSVHHDLTKRTCKCSISTFIINTQWLCDNTCHLI